MIRRTWREFEAIVRWVPSRRIWILLSLVWLLFEGTRCARRIAREETYIFDWDAYMEQASMVVSGGERNYSKIRGDTGALVYPGAHVAIHSALLVGSGWNTTFWTTEYIPKNITGYENRTHRPGEVLQRLQYLYLLVYLATVGCVAAIFRESRVPIVYLLFLVIGHRVPGIYVLGLFNDVWAMLLLYASVLAFTSSRWTLGSVLFSTAVGVKMNILLFAPGLLSVLLRNRGWSGAVRSIAICGAVQLLWGLPFLRAAPLAYIGAAFNLGRQFDLENSVNFRFLPEAVFHSKAFSLGLLLLLVASLLHVFYRTGGDRTKALSRKEVIVSLFVSNFLGVAFARSLHYQFLTWYFHSLPILLWHVQWHPILSAAWLGALEYAWNTHPPSSVSAIMVSALHGVLVAALVRRGVGVAEEEEEPPTLRREGGLGMKEP